MREVRAFARLARERGRPLAGCHHRNHVLPLTAPAARALRREAGTPVTVRIRRAEAPAAAIRTWRDEGAVLDSLRGVLPGAPECLFQGDAFAIHTHVEGAALSGVCADGEPVDALLVRELADHLARTTQVRREALPPLPPQWPRNDRDGQGFLRTLARRADRQIRRPGWDAFGGLFAALGVPGDALTALADRAPAMARRPFGLLHADLHRDNVILTRAGAPPLVGVDWELATYGDPLHDLATHLVRMRYPGGQWAEVIDAWAGAMGRIRPAAVTGLATDLRHYVAFERAQSVYPDVMRAARGLEGAPGRQSLDEDRRRGVEEGRRGGVADGRRSPEEDQRRLEDATAAVRRALEAAAEPLGLRDVPAAAEIERALFRWRASRAAERGGPDGDSGAVAWSWDPRFPPRPDFPEAAVGHALAAEGGVRASRVFKGTAHLNSVVRVPGYDRPVVVRRTAADVRRREPRYLSEHAVLRAVERSGAPVAAPRVLALGFSHRGEQYAIHTYVGPEDADRPPAHPVHGLLPHEADGLVDQLRALTGVDYASLDPVAGEETFFTWLCDQLVLLVGDLPEESRRLARLLGLPDAARLRQILSRYRVSPRRPALLHGDLNPWNLVRRDDALALTIIDWEMALIGDPLYDLVRHMHLTPTRPEIRARMFRRWESRLDAAHTAEWQQDWRVYRWVETVRSAYVDLDRLATGAGLDAPNVRRAVDSYAMTLAAAAAPLGLTPRPTADFRLAQVLT
ncbi:aminoglycoside phosphotransferase family protein [Streptomyces sp. NPDC046985]|uniref:phosphotransferase family protein n=1 Tax=Streptomyces sp. NPDC046985 TaxID=3155377 RepID=UPI0033F8BFFA